MDKEQNMNNNVDWKQWIPFSKSTSALWRPLKPKNNAVAIWPVTCLLYTSDAADE